MDRDEKKIAVLFVCLGNICRSPSAEGVFKALIEKQGCSDRFTVDSAGVIGAHSGERADRRMRDHAEERGYSLDSRSRRFYPSQDFDQFDLIIGMDNQNMNDLTRMANSDEERAKLYRMTRFSVEFSESEIPDPYYGGEDGFELVLDLLEDACQGLLKHLGY